MFSSDSSDMRQRLKAIREQNGVSARELSALADLSPAMVSHVENAVVEAPSMAIVARIAAVLGADLEWLVNGRGDAPTTEQAAEALASARARRFSAATGTDG